MAAMNLKFQDLLLIAALYLSAICLVLAGQGQDASKSKRKAFYDEAHKFGVVRIEHITPGGEVLEFEGPINDDLEFTEKKLKFDDETFAEMSKFFVEASAKLLRDNVSVFRLVGLGPRLFNVFMGQRARYHQFLKGDTSPRMAKSYTVRAGQMLVRLAEAKTSKKGSGLRAYERVVNLMEGLKKLISHSPSGVYFDWTKITVNGQPLYEWCAPISQALRDNGRGLILATLKKIGETMIARDD